MILLRAEGFMPGCSMHDTMGGERTVTVLRGKSVHLPDGRRLGSVQDAVVDLGTWTCAISSSRTSIRTSSRRG